MALPVIFKTVGFLGVSLLIGCAAQPPVVEGTLPTPTPPAGEQEIVRDEYGIRAWGRLDHGKMIGTWTFFDHEHIKMAEITYEDDKVSGAYRAYFDVLPFPKAYGKVRFAGELRDGLETGRHVSYDATGRAFTDAVFEKGRIIDVRVGARKLAVKTAATDARFVWTLDGAIRSAPR